MSAVTVLLPLSGLSTFSGWSMALLYIRACIMGAHLWISAAMHCKYVGTIVPEVVLMIRLHLGAVQTSMVCASKSIDVSAAMHHDWPALSSSQDGSRHVGCKQSSHADVGWLVTARYRTQYVMYCRCAPMIALECGGGPACAMGNQATSIFCGIFVYWYSWSTNTLPGVV